VLREYTLLNVLPRDISDAHMSGALHIDGLSTWILKPSEVMHDLRFFLQNGIQQTTLILSSIQISPLKAWKPLYPPHLICFCSHGKK
jgi:anaerobic ribonucleoside-triphosphate reductase